MICRYKWKIYDAYKLGTKQKQFMN